MRCKSFKFTSLLTYSSNQLKFVFDVVYEETKRQSNGTHGEITTLYIKDSNHALEIFRNFNFSSGNKIILPWT